MWRTHHEINSLNIVPNFDRASSSKMFKTETISATLAILFNWIDELLQT